MLGVPIGSDEFIATYLEDVCAKLAHLAKRIGLLKSAIAKFLLLRACFGTCRINHLLRSLPFEHGRSLSEKTATIVRDNLGHILGSAIPDIHYKLACLPMRRGGLGICNPRLVFGPAFLASNLAFGSSHEELPGRFWSDLLAAWKEIQPDLNLNAATLANIETLDNIEPEDIDEAWPQQKWWQAQVDTQLEVHFKLNASERLRAFQSLNSAHRATDITSLVSSQEGPMDLSSRSWTLLSRMRVGLALDSLVSRPCPGCGTMMDNTGDHVLCCHKLGIYAWHNEIRNELADLCGDLNLRADIEKGPDGSLLRPDDVVVHGRFDEPLAVDVGVVHSLQSSTKIAENQPGDMAKKMEQQKVQERRAMCQR